VTAIVETPPARAIEAPSRRDDRAAARSPMRVSRAAPPDRITRAQRGPQVPKAANEVAGARGKAAEELPQHEEPEHRAQGFTSVQVESTLRGARTIDSLYQQRTAAECGSGPIGFVCRESVRFGLCRDKWSRNEVRGMTVCRVLAREGPQPDQ
jgi:hypothetical protein